MSITVIEDFISLDDCKAIVEYLDNIKDMDSSGHDVFVELDSGYESVVLKDSVSKMQQDIEKEFKTSVTLASCNYVLMPPGSKNDLHSDLVNLDGTPYDDGQLFEYSGLIYLNEYGVDFAGGIIEFPKQGIAIEPKPGMAIFFRGDLEHVHEVYTVESGLRKNIVLFFDKSGRQTNFNSLSIHTK